MTIRSRRETVTFKRPFWIGGVDCLLPAGAYYVITDEEMIEGLSFASFRRVATMIVVPTAASRGLAMAISLSQKKLRSDIRIAHHDAWSRRKPLRERRAVPSVRTIDVRPRPHQLQPEPFVQPDRARGRKGPRCPSDQIDSADFARRCKDDRHHFRFISRDPGQDGFSSRFGIRRVRWISSSNKCRERIVAAVRCRE